MNDPAVWYIVCWPFCLIMLALSVIGLIVSVLREERQRNVR